MRNKSQKSGAFSSLDLVSHVREWENVEEGADHRARRARAHDRATEPDLVQFDGPLLSKAAEACAEIGAIAPMCYP